MGFGWVKKMQSYPQNPDVQKGGDSRLRSGCHLNDLRQSVHDKVVELSRFGQRVDSLTGDQTNEHR